MIPAPYLSTPAPSVMKKNETLRILVVEDEPKVAAFLQKGLEETGYQVDVAYDGRLGEKMLLVNPYNLAILDVNLPFQDGLQLCRKIRQQKPNLFVILLTALSSVDDKIQGFDSGADDYLAKPFEFKELVARIKALSKRMNGQANADDKLKVANLEIDLKTKTVWRDATRIDLTPKEYALLEYMTRNQGRLLTRLDIAQNVWDINFDTGTNVIDVYINFLRKKIDRQFSPKLIHTQVGMGYILKPETV